VQVHKVHQVVKATRDRVDKPANKVFQVLPVKTASLEKLEKPAVLVCQASKAFKDHVELQDKQV
jgi:hypothetical protein